MQECSHRSESVGFPSPCKSAVTMLVFSVQIHDWQGGSYTSWRGQILLLTAYFEHSVGFRSDINANLMHDVCFLTREWRFPSILGADFNFPPSLWQDLTLHGGGIWIKQLGASVVIPEGSSHTCRTGRGQKPDTIDYFMVSACIRPLLQKCEVIKSVPWGPHYGFKLVLNIDFESVLSRQLMGKISRRSHHKVGATLEGSDADLLEEADPSL